MFISFGFFFSLLGAAIVRLKSVGNLRSTMKSFGFIIVVTLEPAEFFTLKAVCKNSIAGD